MVCNGDGVRAVLIASRNRDEWSTRAMRIAQFGNLRLVDCPDGALMRRVAASDSAAFDVIYRRYALRDDVA
jgi:hypothetical protein